MRFFFDLFSLILSDVSNVLEIYDKDTLPPHGSNENTLSRAEYFMAIAIGINEKL